MLIKLKKDSTINIDTKLAKLFGTQL